MKQDKTIFGLFGSGGSAREVMAAVKQHLERERSGSPGGADYEVYFIDVSPDQQVVNGVPCISEDAFFALEGRKHFNVAITDSRLREEIALKAEAKAAAMSIVANSAEVMDGNDIHPSAVICSNAIVTSNSKIGRYFHCNYFSYVAHDCMVGDFVTFAPRVCCNGNTVIGDHAYIGTGAVIRQGRPDKPIVIGERAVVGMGAVVTRDVPADTTVVGNPARPLECCGS